MEHPPKNTIPLKIEALTKYYGNLCAVNHVSFEVLEGEIFGLLGPNGAGKTSIVSTITTLESPTSGKVSIFGHDVISKPKITKSLTGYVPQELINHGFFSLEEILLTHSGYYGKRNNQKQVNYLIDKLSLEEHRHKKVKLLSGGTKRRLLIAKSLVHQPKLLLLDEPTAGLDIELRNTLWTFLKKLRDSGVSILLTTHYLKEAEELCDRVGILDHGTLKMLAPTKEMVNKLTQRRVIFILKEPVSQVQHKYLKAQSDFSLTFQMPSSETLGELISQLHFDIRKIKDLKIREGNLEDAFQNILGNHHEKKPSL